MKKCLIAMLMGMVFGLMPAASRAVPVGLELVLMADVSGSLDATDFNLQRDGYVTAFQSAAVQNAILGSTLGSIAVTLVYWSTAPVQSVPWTLINSAASANAFAAAIAAAPRPSSGSTNMIGAMNFSAPLFNNNGFEGVRRVIDVSGDGAQSDPPCTFDQLNCPGLQTARANALAGGVTTINALWIDDRDFFGDDPTDIINALAYGTLNVIGGVNPFQNIVDDFPDFAAAIRGKLVREVQGAPEPGTTALLGIALLLAVGMVRRRRSA